MGLGATILGNDGECAGYTHAHDLAYDLHAFCLKLVDLFAPLLVFLLVVTSLRLLVLCLVDSFVGVLSG